MGSVIDSAKAGILMLVLYVGFILAMLVLSSFIAQPRRMKFPQNVAFFHFVSIILGIFATTIFGIFNGYSDNPGDAFCRTQMILVNYCVGAGVMWSAIHSFHLYLIFVRRRQASQMYRYLRWYLFFGFVWPAFWSVPIGVLADTSFQGVWCFSSDPVYTLMGLYGPCFPFCVAGVWCSVRVVVVLYKARKEMVQLFDSVRMTAISRQPSSDNLSSINLSHSSDSRPGSRPPSRPTTPRGTLRKTPSMRKSNSFRTERNRPFFSPIVIVRIVCLSFVYLSAYMIVTFRRVYEIEKDIHPDDNIGVVEYGGAFMAFVYPLLVFTTKDVYLFYRNRCCRSRPRHLVSNPATGRASRKDKMEKSPSDLGNTTSDNTASTRNSLIIDTE